MGNNKNLTDDQLKAMFIVADEADDGWWLSNQWNVWLKESNTNERGIPDFSQTTPLWNSNKKKKKYPHCSKSMNCANNLEKQSKSDGPTSWKSGPP